MTNIDISLDIHFSSIGVRVDYNLVELDAICSLVQKLSAGENGDVGKRYG